MAENIDQFIARAEAEDDLDAAREGISKMTVIEYARARGEKPQLLYYYIRAGHIKQMPCGECGRKVIDIASADAYLVERDKRDRERSGQPSQDALEPKATE
jgi:hypothetical protein